MFLPGRILHLILGGLLIGTVLTAERDARSQERPDAPEGTEEEPLSLLERSQRLVANIQKLGPWEEQAELIQRAGDNLFQTYGWDSEADGFAQNMLRDISSIPPWDFSGRFELATQMISDRYDFTPEQLAQVQQKVMMQMFQFFGRHSSKIFQLSEEMISARAQGRPFSPEEVARWSRLAEPMMQESARTFGFSRTRTVSAHPLGSQCRPSVTLRHHEAARAQPSIPHPTVSSCSGAGSPATPCRIRRGSFPKPTASREPRRGSS